MITPQELDEMQARLSAVKSNWPYKTGDDYEWSWRRLERLNIDREKYVEITLHDEFGDIILAAESMGGDQEVSLQMSNEVENFIAAAPKDIHRLIAEVKRLREALQWYANEPHNHDSRYLDCYGQRAREALNPPATFAETRGDMGQ